MPRGRGCGWPAGVRQLPSLLQSGHNMGQVCSWPHSGWHRVLLGMGLPWQATRCGAPPHSQSLIHKLGLCGPSNVGKRLLPLLDVQSWLSRLPCRPGKGCCGEGHRGLHTYPHCLEGTPGTLPAPLEEAPLAWHGTSGAGMAGNSPWAVWGPCLGARRGLGGGQGTSPPPGESRPCCAHQAETWPSKLCRLQTWQARTRVVGKVKVGFGPQPRIGPLPVFTPSRESSGSRHLRGGRHGGEGRVAAEGGGPPPLPSLPPSPGPPSLVQSRVSHGEQLGPAGLPGPQGAEHAVAEEGSGAGLQRLLPRGAPQQEVEAHDGTMLIRHQQQVLHAPERLACGGSKGRLAARPGAAPPRGHGAGERLLSWGASSAMPRLQLSSHLPAGGISTCALGACLHSLPGLPGPVGPPRCALPSWWCPQTVWESGGQQEPSPALGVEYKGTPVPLGSARAILSPLATRGSKWASGCWRSRHNPKRLGRGTLNTLAGP